MSTAPRRRRPAPPLLGALLRFAWQQLRRHMARELRAAGFADLQDAHLSVFQYPGPHGMRPSDLARQLRVSRQAANHLISQLEALGYLERRAELGEDRRRVCLTSRGRELMTAIKSSVRRFEARCERAEGRARFHTFLEVLRDISADRS